MCRHDKSTSAAPASVRADSTLSYISDGTEFSDSIPDVMGPTSSLSSLESKDYFSERNESSSSKVLRSLSVSLAGVSLAAGMLGFALWLPFVSVPEASTKTYEFAFWSYDSAHSHFDNTVWTFGTDYVLALIMGVLAYSILKYSQSGHTDRLCKRSASLLLLYMISVTAGGIAHQTFTTLESRNTMEFRALWTICVGTVTLANTSMGLSATEIVRKFQKERLSTCQMFDEIPHIPQVFWYVYGLLVTAFTAWGGMSFQRPACDIFIAGVTQTPSTFYMMATLFFLEHDKILLRVRIVGIVGFILNCPLLPMYPMLIQYTNMSLASVNTLLHCWLTVAWSMQGYSMRHVIQAIYSNEKKIKQS